MKRFQECTSIEKLWRYRFYIAIPFLYFYYQMIKPFKVYIDEWDKDKINKTNNYEVIKGNELWETLIGSAQTKMNWTYTTEEVFEKLKSK